MIRSQPLLIKSSTQQLLIPTNAHFLKSLHPSRRELTPAYLWAETERHFLVPDFGFKKPSFTLPGTRMYFVPGFREYVPQDAQLRYLAQIPERGLALITSSPDENYIRQSDQLTFIGGRYGFYCEDWRLELATLIQRIYVDVKEQQALGKIPERAVFIGHSKGGGLLHGLAAFAKAHAEGNIARLNPVFPNLKNVPDFVQAEVAMFLRGAFYLVVGNSFDGFPDWVMVNARLMGTTGLTKYYIKSFVEDHYAQTGLLPEDPVHGIDAVLTTQAAHTVFDGMFKQGLRWFLKPFSPMHNNMMATMDWWSWVSALWGDGHSDGLVHAVTRTFPYSRHVAGFNHLEQLDGAFAPVLAETLREAILRSKKTHKINERE